MSRETIRPSRMTRQSVGRRGRRYSRRMARRFAACGEGIQIVRPADIKNPGSIRMGDAVVIREHVWLNCGAAAEPVLTIGNGTYIGRFCHINANRSVVIEDEVLIADRVHIADHQHAWRDPDRSILAQGVTDPEPVRIGAGSWIGVGAVVMPGVTIGRGAIVGANAVVTRDVAEFSIVGGIPATVIGSRRP